MAYLFIFLIIAIAWREVILLYLVGVDVNYSQGAAY